MKNLLLATAIGDISGVPYEFEGRTKNYDAVDLLNPDNTYSDDTICTFACAGKAMIVCTIINCGFHEIFFYHVYNRPC